MVTLDVQGHSVDVYTTHAVAQYDSEDEYWAHRLFNMVDYAQMVLQQNQLNPPSLVVVTGDLNCIPSSPEGNFFIRELNLRDSLVEAGIDGHVSTHYFDACRLDYVLYQPSAQWTCKNSFLSFTCENLANEETREETTTFYSDHLGVCAYFELEENAPFSQEADLSPLGKESLDHLSVSIGSRLVLAQFRQGLHLKRAKLGVSMAFFLFFAAWFYSPLTTILILTGSIFVSISFILTLYALKWKRDEISQLEALHQIFPGKNPTETRTESERES